MLRRFLVLAALLVVAGCCCRPDPCNPCDQPNPCDPCPQPPPQPPPGGGDFNCATFDTDDCDPATGGLQSRSWLLNEIETRVNNAGTSISPTMKSVILGHISKYEADRNCKGNFNDGTGDCAPIGAVNCNCIRLAYQAAMMGDWVTCSTKLAHGH